MNTANVNILKSFYSVTNRSKLNREVYNYLLERWGLTGVNLKEEQMRVENKLSKLSKSKRAAIKEFLILEELVLDMERKEVKPADTSNNMTMNNDTSNSTLIVGNV